MKLEDLIPEKAAFKLSSTGKEYELRIPNLEDRVDFVKLCGGQDQVLKVFEEKRWNEICRIVFRLMKDKSDFIAKKESQIDDEGFEREVIITGPVRLLRAVVTQEEAIHMLGALTSAISAGEPLVQAFLQSEVKKNMSLSTGESFSMSLPPNTAIHPKTLDNSPSESFI